MSPANSIPTDVRSDTGPRALPCPRPRCLGSERSAPERRATSVGSRSAESRPSGGAIGSRTRSRSYAKHKTRPIGASQRARGPATRPVSEVNHESGPRRARGRIAPGGRPPICFCFSSTRRPVPGSTRSRPLRPNLCVCFTPMSRRVSAHRRSRRSRRSGCVCLSSMRRPAARRTRSRGDGQPFVLFYAHETAGTQAVHGLAGCTDSAVVSTRCRLEADS